MRSTLVIAMLATYAMAAAPASSQTRAIVPHAVTLRLVVPRLTVLSVNDLAFGTIFPGIPTSVPVADPSRAGLFKIVGATSGSVRVDFLLPAALISNSGDQLPLEFAHTDGFAGLSRDTPAGGLSFDPHQPLIGTLGPDGRLWLRLGATALPHRPQPNGAYSATIYVSVYELGS